MPAAGDERLDGVAHAPRPVLVVADAEQQPAPVEHVGVLLEVGVGGVPELDALGLGPAHEPSLLPGPAGHAVPRREVLGARRAPVAPLDEPRRGVVLGQHPRRQRPGERLLDRAGVEVQPALVVVGVPGVGGQLQHDPARTAHDEPRRRRGVVEVHDVHARRPVRTDGDRCRVAVAAPHDVRVEPVAHDLDPPRRTSPARCRVTGSPGRTLCGQQYAAVTRTGGTAPRPRTTASPRPRPRTRTPSSSGCRRRRRRRRAAWRPGAASSRPAPGPGSGSSRRRS